MGEVGGPSVSHVDVNGEPCRVWRKGSGKPVAFLAGQGGLPKWTPFLDRLAERYEVVAPSLPGYPGGSGHTLLDGHLDWILAVRDLLNGCGLEGGDTCLAGSGPGASFALEIAALWPHKVAKLAVVAPWGLYDEAEPMTDPWAQRQNELPGMLCADPGIGAPSYPHRRAPTRPNGRSCRPVRSRLRPGPSGRSGRPDSADASIGCWRKPSWYGVRRIGSCPVPTPRPSVGAWGAIPG